MVNKEELINFEKWVVDTFNEGKLRSPVHLSGGDEEQIIKVFENVNKEDWIFTNYRSHYHTLLKGVNPEWLKKWILENKSIHVMNKEHKIFTSAIVGGQIPIAVGVALAIKLKKEKNKVVTFCGDMAGHTGIFWECLKYSRGHRLPIKFIIADNGLSTDTPTKETWGISNDVYYRILLGYFPNLEYYQYDRTYPHYGTGKFISSIWEDIKKEDVINKGF